MKRTLFFIKDVPLDGDDLLDPLVRELHQAGEVLPGEGALLGRGLDLDELAVVGLDDVHVEVGRGILAVVEVEELPALDEPDAHRGDEVLERHGLDVAEVEELLQGQGQGDAAGGDRGRPRPAVGLEDVAVDEDRSFRRGPRGR